MARSAFVDEIAIVAVGGGGGDGVVRFLRERARPRGGPDGGDGGRGGDVVARAEARLNSFVSLRGQREFRAQDGAPGGDANKRGADGENATVRLPPGARIVDADTGRTHAVLTSPGDESVLARGGRGGLGNARFKSAVNRAPRRRTSGEPREVRRFRLELRLPAEVGLCGAPNAGKSALLRAMSAARPKVADYPFTTTAPQLGFVSLADDDAGALAADTPGLIAGAADGAGLGSGFLRHLSSVRLAVVVADASEGADSVCENFRTVSTEMVRGGGKSLGRIPKLLALNKMDAVDSDVRTGLVREVKKRLGKSLSGGKAGGGKVFPVSAKTGEGVEELARAMIDS